MSLGLAEWVERTITLKRKPTLADFRKAYSGRVAILLSGTTAAEQDLDRIRCPILGVNKSYHLVTWPRTCAHVLSGVASAALDAPVLAKRWPAMPVFCWKTLPAGGALPNANDYLPAWGTGGAGLDFPKKTPPPGGLEKGGSFSPQGGPPGGGYSTHGPYRVAQACEWSFEATHGVRWIGAAVAALQLGVYLGFDEIVFVGLDLKRRGRHLKAWEVMNGEPLNPYDATADYRRQGLALASCMEALSRTHPHVHVLNVSHDTSCEVITRAKFDEVFE